MIKSPELLFGKIIKSWRQKELGLPASTQKRPAAPVIYAYSPAVVPVPSDWGRNVCVSGYWFLGEPSTWAPPASLAAFLHAGPPPVYVGFGSMPIADAGDMATMFINALERTGRRGVIAAGWGGLGASTQSQNIHFIESAPHDRLFPLMDAVVHHGGAGTTAAGLRAGKPTVICPFFGDQPFWARRVQALGAGPPPLVRRKLTVDSIAAAIIGATSTENIRANAEAVGRKIRSENGVGVAVDFIARRVASELDEVVLRRRH
jgi:UDP:flavonoid glycosyltransferase YjiC (YdhE family)